MNSWAEMDEKEAWRALRWSSAAVFMALLDATILFVAFPSIRRSFPTVSAADLSWILNAYTVVYAALLVPGGRRADRHGRRRVFLDGIGLFTIGSLACLLAPTAPFLIAGRVIQAAGGALLTPSSLALVLSAFPRPKWSLAVSLWAATGALAGAVGPSLGAALVQLGGWRWAFIINLPIGIILWTRGRRVFAESRDRVIDAPEDIVGIALLVISVALIALGIVKAPEWRSGAAACAAAGVVLLAIFVWRSLRVGIPVLDLSLFRARSFRWANAATLVFGAAFSAMFLGSVLFLTTIWGYNTARAGLAFTPGPLLVIGVAPLAGRLAARVGYRPLLVSGGVMFGLGFVLRWLVTSSTPHYMSQWLPVVLTTGIGVGLIVPCLAAASAQSLPPDRFAVGSAVNQAVRQIGSVLGVAVAIAVVGRAHGPDAFAAFSRMFLVLAGGGFLTAAMSLPIDISSTRQNVATMPARRTA